MPTSKRLPRHCATLVGSGQYTASCSCQRIANLGSGMGEIFTIVRSSVASRESKISGHHSQRLWRSFSKRNAWLMVRDWLARLALDVSPIRLWATTLLSVPSQARASTQTRCASAEFVDAVQAPDHHLMDQLARPRLFQIQHTPSTPLANHRTSSMPIYTSNALHQSGTSGW